MYLPLQSALTLRPNNKPHNKAVAILWFGLFCLILIGAGISNKTPIPSAVIWALLGLACIFVPEFPPVRLDPHIALYLILPPLVYASSVQLPWPEFRKDLRPIAGLAIGLVAATTVAVAVLIHHLAALPWPVAFAAGAILSPTDPVAASAVSSRAGLPRRLVAIIEGEGLVNDGVSLSIFRIALIAWAGGAFSIGGGFLRFAAIIIGEPLYGWLLGMAVAYIRGRIADPQIEITVSLLTPFAAYLVPERLGGSGILATVAIGMYIGERSSTLVPAGTRLHATSVWNIIVFLLNGVFFITAGLEVGRVIRGSLGGSHVLVWGLWTAAAVAGVRVLWCLLSWFGFRALRTALRREPGHAKFRHIAIISWSGMRGPISLAAALSIPAALHRPAGADFEIVLALTAVVIVITLLGQGAVLPFLVRALGVSADARADRDLLEQQQALGESEAAAAAFERIALLERQGRLSPADAGRLRRLYRDRMDPIGSSPEKIRADLIQAERARILALRREGKISDHAMERLQRTLDLRETLLD